MTISLPPEMVKEVEKVRKTERRTRSELIREALRTYFTLGRTYRPTRAELRVIERGRAAMRRGQYYTLDEFRTHLGNTGTKARTKKRPARASA
jgi:predicted transcriptional regulator